MQSFFLRKGRNINPCLQEARQQKMGRIKAFFGLTRHNQKYIIFFIKYKYSLLYFLLFSCGMRLRQHCADRIKNLCNCGNFLCLGWDETGRYACNVEHKDILRAYSLVRFPLWEESL